MSEAAVTVRVRKFMRNPLLKRRQMVCCVRMGLRCRPWRLFILSVLPCLRMSWRPSFPRSTTSRTISALSSLDSKLPSVGCVRVVLRARRWSFFRLCSDLRFSGWRQEVRGQVPPGQSRSCARATDLVVRNSGVSQTGTQDAEGKEEPPEEDLGNGSSCCSSQG